MRRLLAWWLISTLWLASSQGGEWHSPDHYIQKTMKDWDVPGLAVAVIRDGKILLARGYGVRERGGTEPVDEHTLFAIASNSKAFTSAALAMLKHEGKVNWDDRVQKHLPWFQVFQDPWISHEIRVDDLLCHRIGFRTFSGDLLWWNTPYSAREVVERARFLEPKFGLRRGYGYSNIMFIAAGEVVAAGSGTSWESYIRSGILEPLGMTNTVLRVSELAHRNNVASPHGNEEDGTPFPIPWQDWDSVAAAGGVISSVADLAQWLRLQLGEGQLDGKTFWSTSDAWKMWSIHNPMPFTPDGLEKNPEFSANGAGLGWFVADYQGELIVRHGGGYDGMFSHTVMAPKKKAAVVVLSNSMTPLPRVLAFHLLDGLIGTKGRDWHSEALKVAEKEREEKKKGQVAEENTRKPDTSPTLPLKEYAGTYGGEMYGDAIVSLEDEKLVLRFLPAQELAGELIHWQHDVFEIHWFRRFAWFGKGKVQFLLNLDGKPAEFKMDVPNEDLWFEELEFKRKPDQAE